MQCFVLFCQYYADANEAESWIKEKMPLVTSKDYGKDEPSAKVCLAILLLKIVDSYLNDL